MIQLYVYQTPEGFECMRTNGNRWSGETIQASLQAFEREYIASYGLAPIYRWQ